MPRRRSNNGRLTRQAKKLRQQRKNRTAEQRAADNERAKLAAAKNRAEEHEDKRAERLKMLRIQSRKKRAVRASQRRRENLNQMIKQIENPNSEAIEKTDINCILFSCELTPSAKMGEATNDKGVKNEGPSPNICKENGEKVPESEEPVDPFKILSNWINDH